MSDLKDQFRRVSESLGFDAFGVSSPFVGAYLDSYREMVSQEHYGDMGYLARHLPMKEDPNLLLPNVKSAIVLAKNYKNTSDRALDGDLKVARYAAGLDYHDVIFDKVQVLLNQMAPSVGDAQFYIGVDSRPLPERTLAILAGIGFKGKNSMIIRPKLGSYFLLSVILTTLKLPFDRPLNGGCGTCTRCIDACPTNAIGSNGSFNYTACVSYQTIEKKTRSTETELDSFGGWIFGCDICQEVCPFNHPAIPLTNWPEFSPSQGVGHHLDDPSLLHKGTALHRSKKRVLANLETLQSRES